jgi:hypothetical protein
MRAKLVVVTVQEQGTPPSMENLTMRAVGDAPYSVIDGTSDDNTFARYTPNASFTATINNPALLGQFKAGQKYYVDFTEAPS